MLQNVGGHCERHVFAGAEGREDGLNAMVGVIPTGMAEHAAEVTQGVLTHGVIDEGLDAFPEGQAGLQDSLGKLEAFRIAAGGLGLAGLDDQHFELVAGEGKLELILQLDLFRHEGS